MLKMYLYFPSLRQRSRNLYFEREIPQSCGIGNAADLKKYIHNISLKKDLSELAQNWNCQIS